jgi:hypothetical protein
LQILHIFIVCFLHTFSKFIVSILRRKQGRSDSFFILIFKLIFIETL